MDYSKFVIFAVIYLVVAGVGIAIYAFYQIRHMDRINKSANISKKSRNKLYVFYKLFRTLPVINKIFSKVLANTESVYPADVMSINREATKIMLKACLYSIMVFVVTAFLSKGEIWYLMMGILTALVIFHYNLTAIFSAKEYILLEQMKDFLSAVRHHYLQQPIVEDAIDSTMDEIPYEIRLHISRIHEILVSPMMEEKTEEYTSTSPNRFFLLLLSICTSTKEYTNGETSFLDSLSYLKEEIDIEILKQDAIRKAFSCMSGVCLCSVFFIKPIEAWAISNMPDLSDFYAGFYGKALLVLIFLFSFASYYLVNVLKQSHRGEIVKKNIWTRLSNLPFISPLLNKTINKYYTKSRKTNEDMKEVGDQTGPKAFLMKRCVFAVIAFALVNSTVFVSTVQEKLTMLKYYVAEFDNEVVPNERYLQVMEMAAYDYANSMKQVKELSNNDIKGQLISSGTIRNETYAQMVADEVIRVLDKYHNTYYKWYMFLASILIALFAFMIPKWYLAFKCKVSSMNKEEEVNQFRTLILILMHADGIHLEEILEWMERFAYSFKSTLEDCIIALESGEKKALEAMQHAEDNKSFQRFVDCLLAIDDTDIEIAFAEVIIDRNYSIKRREQDNKELIQRRSSTAGIIAFVPVLTLLVGYLITPMLILAVKMFFAMDFTV